MKQERPGREVQESPGFSRGEEVKSTSDETDTMSSGRTQHDVAREYPLRAVVGRVVDGGESREWRTPMVSINPADCGPDESYVGTVHGERRIMVPRHCPPVRAITNTFGEEA